MILPKCAICGSKKSKFIKNQEAKGLLSSLGLKTPLSKSRSSYWLEINLCLKYILDNQGLPIVLVDHLHELKKEYKSLKKLEIRDMFRKMN